MFIANRQAGHYQIQIHNPVPIEGFIEERRACPDSEVGA